MCLAEVFVGDAVGEMESVHLPKPLCRVPAALAVVLSEAGGCGREAVPEMRAVGGARSILPTEDMQGALPPEPPLVG